jgi:hypothetical protein
MIFCGASAERNCAAKARGRTFGRTLGYRPSDKPTGEVIRLIQDE